MRLIDPNNLQFNGRNYNKNQMKAILDFIDEQPYNPDKIVEQLEEYREEMEQFGCGGMLTDMIEIVKGGGVDAQNSREENITGVFQ